MTSVVAALDQHASFNVGENGKTQHSWSTINESLESQRDSVSQLFFQLTRCDDHSLLREKLNSILTYYKTCESGGYIFSEEENEVFNALYKLIPHTRDIVDGKGEYNLTYMMIFTWWNYYPKLAEYAIYNCLILDENQTKHLTEKHPYGSWKDVKYFCNYVLDKTKDKKHPLITYCLDICNFQLNLDIHLLNSSYRDQISLCGKWFPRESSKKFGWLFKLLAVKKYNYIYDSADSEETRISAKKKCSLLLRKDIVRLNTYLDTVQIKQCKNEWSTIDHNKTTSITLHKNKKAFQNLTKQGTVRCPYSIDRKKCADNFEKMIKDKLESGTNCKGKRLSLVDFTKEALKSSLSDLDKDVLNSQWKDNSSQNGNLDKIIAMVDTSGSMHGDPLYAAIALGIRVAEKSALGKRVMTFSNYPQWIDISDKNNFIDMVKHIHGFGNWGFHTNFTAAMQLILDSIVKNKVKPHHVEGMVLAIFSDMQIDENGNEKCNETMFKHIEYAYYDAGMRMWGVPFKPPHILFWNLRSTTGFPCSVVEKNTTMFSGFSPALLNTFVEKGPEALQNMTPWNMLMDVLSNERYQHMNAGQLIDYYSMNY